MLIALTPAALFLGLLALATRKRPSRRRILLVLLIWEVAASAVIYALFSATRTEAAAKHLDNIGIPVLYSAFWLWTALLVPAVTLPAYGLLAWRDRAG